MASYDPDTEVYTLPFSELNTFLQGLTAGTYKLNITEMVASDIGDSTTSGTLGYKIRSVASDVKIDLSETVLPAGITDMSKCFYSCTSLTTAPVIPNSVTNMTYCFQFCTSLTTAPSIPDSVTNIYYCFYHCEALTIAPLIPNSVINMQGCFAGTSLTTAPEIPDSVENMIICFSGCSLLTEPPVIPSSVTDIRQCFGGCTSLTIAPTIPNSVTDMSNCFSGCTSLTIAPTIPDSVTDMTSCFGYCSSLTIVPAIPDSVTVMNNCFEGCTALTDITWDMGDISGTYPAVSCFDSCSKLTNIWVPNLSKELETENFITTNKSTMHFPSSKDVKTVVKSLTNQIKFVDLDTYLRTQSSNTKTTPYVLNVIEISNTDDFKVPLHASSSKYVDLSETILPDTITDMSSYFSSCSTLVKSPSIPDTVDSLFNCFNSCSSLIEAPAIPDSVTNMQSCFYGCTSLTTAPEIPDSVTNMSSCFWICIQLTEAPIIPDSVIDMSSCFRGCTRLTTVPNIPDSVTNIENCFYGCTALTDITWDMGNISSFNSCFYNCSGLTNIWTSNLSKELETENFITTNKSALSFSKDVKTVVKSLTNQIRFIDLDTYLQAQPSNTTSTPYELNVIEISDTDDFKVPLRNNSTKYVDLSETVLPNSITDMTSYFRYCSSLIVSPEIPDSVTDMSSCFQSCTSLVTAPVIPDSVTNIMGCFSDCTNLSEAPVIPNSVTNMESCFEYCRSLTTATTIPSSVTSMAYCFASCSSLTTVPAIPDSVTNMNYCFAFCTSLTAAPSIPNSVTNMSNCFEACNSLITAPEIPNSVTNMSSCFGYCSSLTIVPAIPDSVTVMNYCFESCYSLTDITWNIGNVSQFFRCFSDCTSLQEIKTPSKLKEAKTEKFLTTNRSNLGLDSSYDIPTLVTTDATTIPYADVDEYLGYLEDNTTSTPYELNVVDIGFEDVMADVLVDHTTKFVDLSNTVLPNKTDFTEEFINCVNLITPPAITTTAVNITNMFKGCSNLSSSPLIPNSVINMTGTFDGCSSLTEAPAIPDSVVNMTSCFKDSGLTEGAEIPNSVTNMSYCYNGCEDLTSVPNIPPYATDLSHCFENCDNLVTIESFEISYNNLQNVDMTDVFKLCTSLTNVCIPQPNISDGDVWKLVKVSLSDETYEIFSVTDGVEEKTGTISVTASKNTLVIDGVSDEIIVAGEDEITQTKVQQYFTYHKAFTSDPNTLTPDGHKFVLWAKDPSEVVSNVLGGGGGSSFVQNVTQEQYDALTPAEKNNGQIRHITDAEETPVPFAVVNDSKATASNVWTAQKTNTQIEAIKEYVLDQQELSDYKTIGTENQDLYHSGFISEATAYECPYDGFVFASINRSSSGGWRSYVYCKDNDDKTIEMKSGSSADSSHQTIINFPVKKGYKIWSTTSNGNDNLYTVAMWYEKRDYSTRD